MCIPWIPSWTFDCLAGKGLTLHLLFPLSLSLHVVVGHSDTVILTNDQKIKTLIPFRYKFLKFSVLENLIWLCFLLLKHSFQKYTLASFTIQIGPCGWFFSIKLILNTHMFPWDPVLGIRPCTRYHQIGKFKVSLLEKMALNDKPYDVQCCCKSPQLLCQILTSSVRSDPPSTILYHRVKLAKSY